MNNRLHRQQSISSYVSAQNEWQTLAGFIFYLLSRYQKYTRMQKFCEIASYTIIFMMSDTK